MGDRARNSTGTVARQRAQQHQPGDQQQPLTRLGHRGRTQVFFAQVADHGSAVGAGQRPVVDQNRADIAALELEAAGQGGRRGHC